MFGGTKFQQSNLTGYTPMPSLGVSYKEKYYGNYYSPQKYTPMYDQYQGMDLPGNNPYKTVDNYKLKLAQAGQVAPERKGEGLGNVLMTVLDVLQRPGYAVMSAIEEGTNPDRAGVRQPLQAALEGLKGVRKTRATDVFENVGWYNDPDKKWFQGSNLLRNTLGFVADVALDPLMYGTGLTMSAAKAATTSVGSKTVRNALEGVLTKHYDDFLRTVRIDRPANASKMSHYLQSNNVTTFKSGDDVLTAIRKHGDNGNVVHDLAAVLMNTNQTGSAEAIERLLTNGFKGFNPDEVQRLFLDPLKMLVESQGLQASEYHELMRQMNKVMGSLVHRKNNKLLEPLVIVGDKEVAGMKIADVMINAPKRRPRGGGEHWGLNNQQKVHEAMEQLFKSGDDALSKAKWDKFETEEAFELTKVLAEYFKVDNAAQLDSVIGIADKLATARNRSFDKLFGITEQLAGNPNTQMQIKRINDGLSFGHDLLMKFDEIGKNFYLAYHNPITQKIVPLVDITKYAKSDLAKTAWRTIAEANPLVPVLAPVGKIARSAISHISPHFKPKTELSRVVRQEVEEINTKRVEKGLPKLTKQEEEAFIKEISYGYSIADKEISGMLREQTFTASKSAMSVKWFSGIDSFQKHPEFRKLASVFIQQNSSPNAKAGFLYLTGESSESVIAKKLALDEDDFKALQHIEEVMATKSHTRNAKELKHIRDKFISLTDAEKDAWLKDLDITQKQNAMGMKNLNISDQRAGISWTKDGALDELPSSKYTPRDPETYVHQSYDMRGAKPGLLEDPKGINRNVMKVLDEEYSSVVAKKADPRSVSTAFDKSSFKEKKYESFMDSMLENLDLPTHFDLSFATAKRVFESEAVALAKNFVNDLEFAIAYTPLGKLVKSTTGWSQDKISRETPKGYRKVDFVQGKVTYMVHPEIEAQFNRMASLWNPSESSTALYEFFLGTQNAIKTLQTTYNPSFMGRNLIGETLMNYIKGVSVKSSMAAAKILKNYGKTFKVMDTTYAIDKQTGLSKKVYSEYIDKAINKGRAFKVVEDISGTKQLMDATLDTTKWKHEMLQQVNPDINFVDVNGRMMSEDKVYRLFNEVGLGWSGITMANVDRNLPDILDEKVLAQKYSSGSLKHTLKRTHQNISKPGEWVEEWTRLSHFIHNLEEGMDVISAANDVRKYHVDYRDLTRFEQKWLRNLMPFYTYMRKNTEIQVKLLTERVNKIHLMGSLVSHMYENVQRDNAGQELVVPDYLKEGIAIPLNVNDDGEITYLNWGMPITDIGRLKYDLRDFVTENFYQMWSPMIKNPTEYALGRSMMYGNNLEPYEGAGRELLQNVQGSPIIPTFADQMLSSLGIVQSARKGVAKGVANYQQTGEFNLGNTLKEVMFGSLLPTRDQSTVALQQAYDHRDQLYAHIQELKRQGIDVSSYTPTSVYDVHNAHNFMLQQGSTAQRQKGYLGVPDSQLFPILQPILSGRR